MPETEFQRLLDSEGLEAFRRYTQRHLIRVYPAWYRVDSSNYDPEDPWEAGCQIVALNHQGDSHSHKENLWLNMGKFRGNNGCGYVHKPMHLLFEGYSPRTTVLTVTVLSGLGWQTFCSGGNDHTSTSYVCIKLAGVEAQRASAETEISRTKVFSGLGAQPLWNTSFEFNVTDLDLTILVISCWSENTLAADFAAQDDFLGQYAFPLSEALQGWRRIPLLNESGDEQVSNPALLCQFCYIPLHKLDGCPK